MARKHKSEDGEERMAITLSENFVPGFTSATFPNWAQNVTADIVANANMRGSPGFDPGPDQAKQVEQMAALGMTSGDIAGILCIEQKLLEHYYKYELETAASRINQHVAKVALSMALSGADPEMTKFWLKTRAGWNETKKVEVSGAGGGPIEFAETKRRIIEQVEAEIIDVEFEEKKNG